MMPSVLTFGYQSAPKPSAAYRGSTLWYNRRKRLCDVDSMTAISVEERLTAIEQELTQIKQQLAKDKSQSVIP